MFGITDKQAETLNLLTAFHELHHRPPSARELAQEHSPPISSNAVKFRLIWLERKGFVQKIEDGVHPVSQRETSPVEDAFLKIFDHIERCGRPKKGFWEQAHDFFKTHSSYLSMRTSFYQWRKRKKARDRQRVREVFGE